MNSPLKHSTSNSKHSASGYPEPANGSSDLSVGFAFAIASAALFAIRPIFVKLVYAQGIDSTTLIAFRMLFSAPIYAAMLIWLLRDPQKRAVLTKKNISAIMVIGVFGYYIASLLDLLGLQYLTAQLARMILYVYPTMVVILGALFFGQATSRKIVIPLVITYSGVLVIFGHDLNEFGSDIYIGALLILGSALSFSVYLLFAKKLINTIGSRVFTCIALLSASTGIFIHYGLTRSIVDPQVNSTGLFWILIIAIFCTVIPTFFTTAAVGRIGADRTGVVSMIGPAFTSSFAIWILSEAFTVYHAVGITLTIVGVWLLQSMSSKKTV